MNSNEAKKQFWIALTGGIGSGKSEVSKILKSNGVFHIDADEIARELMNSHAEARAKIEKLFGTLDRDKIRAALLTEKKMREGLEKILHPLIHEEASKRVDQLELEAKADREPLIVLYDAALIFEKGRHQDFDALWVVHASRETRLKRLMETRGMSKATAESFMNQQLEDEARLKMAEAHADEILTNHGSLEELKDASLKALLRLKNKLS